MLWTETVRRSTRSPTAPGSLSTSTCTSVGLKALRKAWCCCCWREEEEDGEKGPPLLLLLLLLRRGAVVERLGTRGMGAGFRCTWASCSPTSSRAGGAIGLWGLAGVLVGASSWCILPSWGLGRAGAREGL